MLSSSQHPHQRQGGWGITGTMEKITVIRSLAYPSTSSLLSGCWCIVCCVVSPWWKSRGLLQVIWNFPNSIGPTQAEEWQYSIHLFRLPFTWQCATAWPWAKHRTLVLSYDTRQWWSKEIHDMNLDTKEQCATLKWKYQMHGTVNWKHYRTGSGENAVLFNCKLQLSYRWSHYKRIRRLLDEHPDQYRQQLLRDLVWIKKLLKMPFSISRCAFTELT